MTEWDSEYQSHAPLEVRYLEEGGRGWPEPRYSEFEHRSDLDKLRWKTGVLRARTGLSISIVTGSSGHMNWRGKMVTDRDAYAIVVGNSHCTGFSFSEAWTFINGIESGIALARLDIGKNDDDLTRRKL